VGTLVGLSGTPSSAIISPALEAWAYLLCIVGQLILTHQGVPPLCRQTPGRVVFAIARVCQPSPSPIDKFHAQPDIVRRLVILAVDRNNAVCLGKALEQDVVASRGLFFELAPGGSGITRQIKAVALTIVCKPNIESPPVGLSCRFKLATGNPSDVSERLELHSREVSAGCGVVALLGVATTCGVQVYELIVLVDCEEFCIRCRRRSYEMLRTHIRIGQFQSDSP